MDIPKWAPGRPGLDATAVGLSVVKQAKDRPGLEPAACCAEACVNIPFVGRVCHCVLDLPICP